MCIYTYKLFVSMSVYKFMSPLFLYTYMRMDMCMHRSCKLLRCFDAQCSTRVGPPGAEWLQDPDAVVGVKRERALARSLRLMS